MKTIEELAAELGKAIKEDPRLDAMEKAKTAYDNDPKIQAYLAEFEVQQKALQLEGSKEEPDRLLIANIQGRVDELYRLIMQNESFAALSDAQQAVNELMEHVNGIITFNITGELPSCTGNCSSCGGSCH
ncbi:MAG: YlbF family regulator [Clostridia bacterium]|nr:YlbF family regulator [Clostridia bacterium]